MYSVHWLLYILTNKPQVGFHVNILWHVCKHWEEWFSRDIVIYSSWRSLSCPPLSQWEGMLHVYRASFSFFNSLVTEQSTLHRLIFVITYQSLFRSGYIHSTGVYCTVSHETMLVTIPVTGNVASSIGVLTQTGSIFCRYASLNRNQSDTLSQVFQLCKRNWEGSSPLCITIVLYLQSWGAKDFGKQTCIDIWRCL